MSGMDNGWGDSAAGWLAAMGEHGDFGRVHVLDAPMLARVRRGGFRRAVDIGCGEGRFCRMLKDEGVDAVGVEPTRALREAAQARDPGGDYRDARAERLPFPDSSFDLAVSCLTLIDIDAPDAAVAEMARVVRPGGALLVANLNGFATAGRWTRGVDGAATFEMDRYLEERASWVVFAGLRIRNWHRPLERYMRLFLSHGLRLTHFEEPAPTGGDPERADRYRRTPFFNLMEWRKD